MMVRIMVVGRSGQLATELQRLAPPAHVHIEALGRDRFDMLQLSGLGDRLRLKAPHAVINAAAYTNVDLAESESRQAFALNRDAPGALSRACADLRIPLIHLSTDYVFDGLKLAAYVEGDSKAPLNVYGLSKSEGEDAVLASGAQAAIVRTAWLFSARGTNFVRSMLRLAESRDEISVVADQLGRPTWAKDLAQCCLTVVSRLLDGDTRARGVFHFAGADDASWADFAEAVFEESAARGGRRARVARVLTSNYPTAARRPLNSRLDTTKLATALGVIARPWREALTSCFEDMPLER